MGRARATLVWQTNQLRPQPEPRRHSRSRGVFLCSLCPVLRGHRQSVPGLNSCCQGLRGTSSPALVAWTLVHSCAEALRGWGAVGALRKAGPSPPHTAAWMQGCAFQSRRCPGRVQGRKAGASEGAVTPLGLGWDFPGSALSAFSLRRGWSGARREARAAAGLGAWLPSERGRPVGQLGACSVLGRAEPGSGGSAASALGLVFR